MQGLIAVIIFIVIWAVWEQVYVDHGNIHFWQIVANQPDVAVQWMEKRSEWVILHPDDNEVKDYKLNDDFVGPFKLIAPSIGGKVLLFANKDVISEPEREFIKLFPSKAKKGFPLISYLAMGYPIVAMLIASFNGAPLMVTLGYGFTNLGYLLFAAGVFIGSFRALGFTYRIPIFISAVTVWILGTVLCNI